MQYSFNKNVLSFFSVPGTKLESEDKTVIQEIYNLCPQKLIGVKQKRWAFSNKWILTQRIHFFLPLILNPKSIWKYFNTNVSLSCNTFIMEVVPLRHADREMCSKCALAEAGDAPPISLFLSFQGSCPTSSARRHLLPKGILCLLEPALPDH